MGRGLLLISAGSVVLLAGTASAIGPRVIFSEIVGSPTSQVPGLAGLTFTAFDRPYRSPGSDYWIISGTASTGVTTTDEVLIVGSGPTSVGSATRVQEGVTPIDAGRLIDTASIDTQLSINDSGVFAFTANLSGATTDDEVIVKGDTNLPGAFSVQAREGAVVGPAIPGAIYGTTLASPSVDNTGSFHWRAATMTGVPTTNDNAFLRNDGSVVDGQEGITIPAGQQGTPAAWQGMTDYQVANNGSWLAAGDTSAATTQDGIVVVNGSVVAQEGFPLPGVSPTTGNVSLLTESLMDPDGGWTARGSFATTNNDWILRNGSLVAMTDDTVPGGVGGETWSDDAILEPGGSGGFASTFFAMTGNANGDFVYGGVTTNPDLERNAVLVYNNLFVVARESDPVDVDGNGLYDDNAFIAVFNNDDMFLTDDGWLYFTADLEDSAGTGIGQAYMAVQIPAPGVGLVLGLTALTAIRRRRA